MWCAKGYSWRAMSAETPRIRELHLIVGFDGSPPATRALDTSARLLAVRPPGRITVVWVAHVTSTESLSADAVAIVEHDFDQVARELRAAAAERLDDSQVPWTSSGARAGSPTSWSRWPSPFRPPGPTTW